jgi:hypothetical protein
MDKLLNKPENQVCVHTACALTYNAYYLSSRHLYQYVEAITGLSFDYSQIVLLYQRCSMEMLDTLRNALKCLSCLIRLQGSCMNFIRSLTSLLGCHLCQMTGATLMCMEC